ncbi:MAG: helix-turn-helix transcriptional regulator [Gemmatimonas sp.]
MAVLTDVQRRELGDFLRAQRGRLTPEAFGFRPGRRRTPGLRREEVAQLCGMSATWYTWIEQGRDVSVSPAALARLARVLGLSTAERAYLFALAGKADPAFARHDDDRDPPAAVVAALSSIALPAYILDRTWTARAWNARAERLFVGWLDGGWLDDGNAAVGGDRNLLRYVFRSDIARTLIRDWPERARRLVAEFRADAGRHLDDPPIKALVEELTRDSADFARLWNQHAVLGREGGERTFDHPLDGLLRYEQITLTVAAAPEFKLVMLTEST